MTDTKPGKLLKQGPIATLEGSLNFSENDKFMFNGDQFVHYVAKSPKVIEASANSLTQFAIGDVYSKTTYSQFLNPSGEYRLTDGAPTYTSGTYTGVPTDTYDYVVIGYQIPVSTTQIKFWSEDYIPVELIRVDYGFDGTDFINIPTHVGNVTYTFNDALKIYESEDTPQGQYIYTVDLGAEFTAKYWRIRSFIYSTTIETVTAPIEGKDVDVTTVSGFPSSVSSGGNFYYHNNNAISTSSNFRVSYGDIEVSGSGYVIRDVVISDGQTGIIKAGSYITVAYIGVYNTSDPSIYSQATVIVDAIKSLGTETLDLYVDVSLPAYRPYRFSWLGGVTHTKLYVVYDKTPVTSATYVSLFGNTIETIDLSYFDSDDVIYPGNYFTYSYPMRLTQVQIQERVGPQLRYWESDGSLSVTNLVSISDVYDIVYDNSDDVYYVVRLSKGAGQGNPTIGDDFSSGPTNYFDTNKWELYGNAFSRDSTVDCLKFVTTSGVEYSGSLVSTAYFTDTFTADLNTVVSTLSGTGYFGLSLIDSVDNNQVAGVYAAWDWETAGDGSTIAVSTAEYINSTDNIVTLAETTLDPNDLLEGVSKHTFTYVTSSGWYYSRENRTNPGEYEVASEFNSSSTYVDGGGFTCTLEDSNVTVPAGSYVSFLTQKSTISGVSTEEVVLKVDYDYPTKVVDLGYDDGVYTSLLQASFDSSVVSNNFRAGIVGLNDNYTTISASSLDTTGSVEWGLSCFEVVSMDVEGNRIFVNGVSDAAGSVITTFDVIEDPSKVYSDYYNKVSIATTNEGEGAGGSLFVRVGGDIYKYNKTTLPLTSPEKGSNAAVLASGISMQSNVKHFQYDGYSVGGLSYIHTDTDRGGVYISTIDAGTLDVSSYESELDIAAATVPLARDASGRVVMDALPDAVDERSAATRR